MTQEALKKIYQLLLTEPHAPTVCAQLERIAKEALAEHAMRETQRLGQEIEQEPVAHCKVRLLRGDESFPKVEIDWVNQPVPGPLYTHPPQRTWVGLTDDELLEIYGWRKAPMLSDFIVEEAKQELLGALRKVEAKLKEKNT
jgi:hypothetical protein